MPALTAPHPAITELLRALGVNVATVTSCTISIGIKELVTIETKHRHTRDADALLAATDVIQRHHLHIADAKAEPEWDVLPDLQAAAARKWSGSPACQQAGLFARAAAEIESARKERDELRSTMIAAAEEIQRCWDAHCDDEGYGPANLMRRLEDGIPAQYGYTAGAFLDLSSRVSALLKERDELRERAEAAERNAAR